MIVTYLVAFGFPLCFAVVGWLLLRDLDRWLDRKAGRDLGEWSSFGVGYTGPTSIRELTSTPPSAERPRLRLVPPPDENDVA